MEILKRNKSKPTAPKSSELQDVGGGDYQLPVPTGLAPVYANPEFSRTADALIEAIRHQIVDVEAREYTGKEVLETAKAILESRA